MKKRKFLCLTFIFTLLIALLCAFNALAATYNYSFDHTDDHYGFELLTPESHRMNYEFKTKSAWVMYGSFVNTLEDQTNWKWKGSKGTTKMNFVMDRNTYDEISFFSELELFSDDLYFYTGFLQPSAKDYNRIQSMCGCGANRAISVYFQDYNPKAPDAGKYRKAYVNWGDANTHAVIWNNTEVYCYKCQTEIEMFVFCRMLAGGNKRPFAQEKHNYENGVCKDCGYKTKIKAKKITLKAPPTSANVIMLPMAGAINNPQDPRYAGGTMALTYTLSPAEANSTVRFTSNKPAVATVDENTGLVTGRTAGIVTITATTSEGIKGKIKLTVVNPQYELTFKSGYTDAVLSYKFEYLDSYFAQEATRSPTNIISKKMAKASMALAADAYTTRPSQSVHSVLFDMGFEIIDEQNYIGRDAVYYNPGTRNCDFVAYRIGKKTTRIGNSDPIDLYVLEVRGTPGSAEWYSNFTVGESGDHLGFSRAAEEVEKAILRQVQSSSRPVKVWITGHSRGAAVANLVAPHVSNAIGSDNVYAYTFACPAGVYLGPGTKPKNYPNIKNYNNPGDIVTQIPFEKQWGFSRYGTTILTQHKNRKAIVTRAAKLWNMKKFDPNVKKADVVNQLAKLFPKRPPRGSYDEEGLLSIGGVMCGQISNTELKLLLIRIANAPAVPVGKIAAFFASNGVTTVKQSHTQEFYLAWMDTYAE